MLGGEPQGCIFAENPYKIVVSADFEKGRCAKHVKKVESKICPRLSQKSGQVCCATQMDRCLTQKNGKYLSSFSFLADSPCRKKKSLEKRKIRGSIGQIFDPKKGKSWTDF